MCFNVLGFGRNLYAQSLFVSLILLSIHAFPIPTSGDEAGITERELRNLGFENVSVSYTSEGATVYCEDAVYRYGPDALRELTNFSERQLQGKRVKITLSKNENSSNESAALSR